MRIYVTHCSAKKDDSLRNTGEEVTPDRLYLATPTQRFMQQCRKKGAKWAIFSDKYGVWFSEEKHAWYEKDPNTVSEKEFEQLVSNFADKLSDFSEIWFYHNPGRFHPLYKRLLKETKVKGKITLFTHVNQIT